MKRIFTAVTAALLIAGSCGQWEAVPPGERDFAENVESGEAGSEDDGYTYEAEVEGFIVLGFESSYFYPCRSGEAWWVAAGEELSRRYYGIATDIQERLYIRMSGFKSEYGRHGHLGGADRGFRPDRILEIRKARDGDCRI